ncbi:protein of unknown function DUF255 [Desulfarculus baarsii DSM 2075]|uniref:Spermatogenesis-associated protein 20-like TRX domain-containing protein n=1 Tax=Desulfarculus baarsii (strain ATCC 33931 / DSM 2075 / LMG 7858 / VKM B-1802 / 2st14) TaxID=644282 RepID=E1QFK8_DESB2|nr:thioredoxin domain-containing protein [Desulfarculus baarsii]ADK84344.1 protein of unknown function DUF255 [Desulfarculus baarsii DSM 2075]
MPNALAAEQSPYLRQHADNPVDWLPWGPAALAKARDQQKPIFLSIGYATCHWCHVMAHESFEDQAVADLLNQHYVAVKVDREERPDLDAIYMTACQALSGAGGWPLTALLTPDGLPFIAGTYFPKTARLGRPGLLEILAEVARRWNGPERARMIQAGQEVARAIQPQAGPKTDLDPRALGMAYSQLRQSFDDQFGGFGQAPKFPTPHNLLFLLRWQARNPGSDALAMVEKTLTAMADGGLFDQVGFGFHRYSVDRPWLTPHFEKMLYDQALLAMAYLEAHQLTGREDFAATARQVFTYVLTRMTGPEGGFYAAEDADSEGVEGKYYVWTPQEVLAAAGQADGRLFNDFHGITADGNFEHGTSIPHRRQSLADFATQHGLDADQAAQALERARLALLAARQQRIPPLKDDKIITAWNGLMIAALAKAGQALADEALTAAAARAATFILQTARATGGRLARSQRDGQASGPGFLEDYAFMIWGLIELFEATFELDHLEAALELTDKCCELFWDEADGGYFFSPADGEKLIMRDKDDYDGATPAGNSTMTLNLLRLARLTGRRQLEDMAQQLMQTMAAQTMRLPMAHTMLLMALDFAQGPTKEIVICGAKNDPAAQAMIAKAQQKFIPARALLWRPPEGPEAARLAALAPFTAGMTTVGGRATAYVCQDHVCARPVTDPDELRF